jgi:nitroimidazol reductase NimA-like FMN-containing flavoprotein (pyridoxamine 5'-phosphate oxidase superfamily)
MDTDATGSSTLASAECWGKLRSVQVGRIAFVNDRTGIEVFPINFLVDHGTIVFRTAAGTKLSGVTERPTVVVQADGCEPGDRRWWSVVVRGRAEPIGGRDDLLDAFDIELDTWHGEPKPYFVRVVPTAVEGARGDSVDPSARSPS